MMAQTAAAHGPTAGVGGETPLVVVHAADAELRDPALVGASGGDGYAAADPATDAGVSIEGVGRVSAETAGRVACDAEVVTLLEDRLGRPLGCDDQPGPTLAAPSPQTPRPGLLPVRRLPGHAVG